MDTLKHQSIRPLLALMFGMMANTSFSQQPEPNSDPISPTSLVVLLSHKETIESGRVSVFGYLNGSMLYLSKDHAQFSDDASAIWVMDETENADLYSSSCSGNYVKVVGSLSTSDMNELQLTQVERVIDKVSGNDCYKKR